MSPVVCPRRGSKHLRKKTPQVALDEHSSIAPGTSRVRVNDFGRRDALRDHPAFKHLVDDGTCNAIQEVLSHLGSFLSASIAFCSIASFWAVGGCFFFSSNCWQLEVW